MERDIPLDEYLARPDVIQSEVAKALGMTQSGISEALRTGRKVFINELPGGGIEAYQVRPYPSKKRGS